MPSTKKKENVEFKKLVDELAILGRIVNAIAIEEKVKAGTLNMKDVIRELLNYKESLTLESLTNANVVGLPDELNKLVSVVKEQCGEKDGPCRGLSVVSKGIEAVQSIGKLDENSEKIFAKESPLVMLVTLKKTSESISEIKKTCEILSQNIEIAATTSNLSQPAMEKLVIKILSDLEKITSFPSSLKLNYTADQKNSLEASSINTMISTILKFETINTAFAQKEIDIGVWSKSLKDLEKVLEVLKATFSEDSLKVMDAKMRILIDVNDERRLPAQGKKETFGFHDGAKDLTKISIDLASDFVINVVMNGTSVEELKKLFPYAVAFEEKLKPIMNTKSSIKSRNVALALKHVNKELGSAKTQIDKLDSIQDFFNCYGGIVGVLSVKKLESVQEEINNLQNEFKDFAQKLDDVSYKVNELTKFETVLQGTASEMVEAFKKFKDINLAKKELEEFKKNVEDLIKKYGSLFNFFNFNSNLEELLSTAASMLQNSQSASLSKCINNKKMLENSKKVFNNVESLSDVLVFNSDNKDIAEISDAVTIVKTLISEWGKLEASTTAKPKRSAKTTPVLKDASKVNEQLNKGISVFIDLEDVFIAYPQLEKLLENEKVIDNAVATTNNAEAKSGLALVWTANSKKTLEEVSDTARNKLQQKVPRPNNLSEYFKVFETKLDFKSQTDVDMARLIDNLVAINAQYPNQDDAAILRSLHLNFANAQALLAGGAVAFSSIIPFFNALALKNISSSSNQVAVLTSDPTAGELSTPQIIGIVAGCCFVVGCGFGIFFLYQVVSL